MKRVNIIKHVTIALILAVCFSSCLKNSEQEFIRDFYWEIPRNSKKSVINNMVDGIEFKFCLLNEKGVPAIRFKQGENFSFHFEMINHRRDKLYHDDNDCEFRSIYFGRVISMGQDTICSKFRRHSICVLTLPPEPFYGKYNKMELTINWKDKQSKWFINENNEIEEELFYMHDLPIGEYYTDFSKTFSFIYYTKDPCEPQRNYYVGPITFKINFKIE